MSYTLPSKSLFFNINEREFDVNTHNFPAEGSTDSFTVSSLDNSWSITSFPSWLTLSTTTGGTGDTSVTVTAQANEESGKRNGTITITDGTDTVEITVSQPTIYATSKIYAGDFQINGIFIGDTQISGIYCGDNKLF